MATVKIDGIGINADHFAAMKEPEAIKRMIADGFVPGAGQEEKEEWARKAYSILVKSVIKEKGAGRK